MLLEQFCDRLDRDLLPDVETVEIETPWDKDGTHNRIPSVLVLVRGDMVFPRYLDMLSLINPTMKLQRLTIKSFDPILDIEWYIKEWDYEKNRVKIFTNIRDRAIESRDKFINNRLSYPVEPPKELTISLAKLLLNKSKEDFYVSMLLGSCGIEIARFCQIERAKLGDRSIVETCEDIHAYGNIKVFRQLERRVNCMQFQKRLYK